MALQSSGPISFLDLQNEFGGAAPISLSEYYRGGAYVPVSSSTSGIPASGTISMNQFYGKADMTDPTISPSPNPVSGFGAANTSSGRVTSATVNLNPAGGSGSYTYTAVLKSVGPDGSSPACDFTGNTCKISVTVSSVPITQDKTVQVVYTITAHSGGLDSTPVDVTANLNWFHDNGA